MEPRIRCGGWQIGRGGNQVCLAVAKEDDRVIGSWVQPLFGYQRRLCGIKNARIVGNAARSIGRVQAPVRCRPG